MNKSEKTAVIDSLKTAFDTSSIVIVSVNSGVTVADVRELRVKFKENNSNYKVAKNSLVKIATEGTRFEELQKLLTGPTSIAYSNDPVAVAKVLVNFAKDNEKLKVMGGVMDGVFLDVKQIQELATLPSLDELRGKIVGLLQAPASKIAAVLQAPASQVARVLKAYAEK